MKVNVKNYLIAVVIALLSVAGVVAQDNPALNSTDSAGSGLDLYAVAELFKDSENIEKFEQTLNDPAKGLNNLDLNNDDQIDFIRATEQVNENTHLIILQVPLGENDFQDVATIAVEKESGDKYNLHIQGDPMIYGADYYVVPASNKFSAWNVVRWLFRPNYHQYVSTYTYRVLPGWWSIRHPVSLVEYHTRTGLFAGRRNFVAARTFTVKTISRINYHPRTSTLVVRQPAAVRPVVVVKPRVVTHTTITTVKPVPPRKGRH